MFDCPLVVEEFKSVRNGQDFSDFDLSGNEVMELLSMFDLFGVWRMDLKTGKVFWSRDVFEIHGLEYTRDPVDLTRAIPLYHPEDAAIAAHLLEEAIASRSSFRFALRLGQTANDYRMVNCSGKYRVGEQGQGEMIGLFSQLRLPVRSIAAVIH